MIHLEEKPQYQPAIREGTVSTPVCKIQGVLTAGTPWKSQNEVLGGVSTTTIVMFIFIY